MAKAMAYDEGYRAVIMTKVVITNKNDPSRDATELTYLGPWARASTAKAEVTKARNHLGTTFVDGWIEKATWKRVD